VTASSASVIGYAESKARRGTGWKAENAAVGAVGAASILLADWVSSAQNFVQVFVWVYILLIFAYVLMSWVRLPYSIWMNRIQRFLYDVVEPYLRIFRRILPPLGPLDLSPMIAVIVLIVAGQVVMRVIGSFG
jgi:YggT family protein